MSGSIRNEERIQEKMNAKKKKKPKTKDPSTTKLPV
jgi:hypothetical protein